MSNDRQSYVNKSNNLLGKYKLNFDKETVKKTEGYVHCTVDKDDIEVDIEYKLTKKKDGWKIYDVIVDEASLVQNYKSQFTRFIQKHSFSALLSKMKKKTSKKVVKG